MKEDEWKCLHATQCEPSYGNYPYKNAGLCLKTSPSGVLISVPEGGVYDCGEDYLDLTGKKAKCIASDACTGVPYVARKLCLNENDSYNWNTYGVYLYRSGNKKEYVDANACRKMDHHYAYKYWECSPLPP